MPTGIYKHQKGRSPNSGSFKKGYPKPKNAYTFPTGSTHPNWKGDNVGYLAMHSWVNRCLGKPKKCEHCGATAKERKLGWANKDHKYRRNLGDYISLCWSCHKKYDLENGLCQH